METPSRFELKTAIQTWQQELAAQPNLTAEARHELQTRLGDTVADLQRRGFNDEESFWLARRRVGQPYEPSEECSKAAPIGAGREKAIWMMGALFAFFLWQSFVSTIANYFSRPSGSWISQVILALVVCLPLAGLAFSILRGGSHTMPASWLLLFRSRRRFCVVACISVLAIRSFQFAVLKASIGAPFFIWVWRPPIVDVILMALIVWLLPAAEPRTLQRPEPVSPFL